MQVIETIVVGVLLLTALVVIHEFGHFATARAFKVRVSEFMVGLPGPHVILFKKGGTRFGISAYLFGGYARIAGMDPTPEDPLMAPALAYAWRQGVTDAERLSGYLSSRGTLPVPGDDRDVAQKNAERCDDILAALEGWASLEEDDTREFRRERKEAKAQGRELWQRYRAPEDAQAHLSSGQPREVADENALLDEQRKGTYLSLSVPKRLLCLIAGPLANILTAIVVLMLILCVNGVYAGTTTLSDVEDGSPASEMGLEVGDTITALDGTELSGWDSLSQILAQRQPGDQVQVTWTHEGTERSGTATLAESDGSAFLGVVGSVRNYKYPVGEAFLASLGYIGTVAVAILNLFNPFQAQEVLSQSSSVVGASVMAQQALSMGAASFGMIVAAISVSLGLMNLLPIPPLDGGKVLVEIIQAVRRKAVSLRVQSYISVAGMTFFVLLFVYTLVQDIGRVASGFFVLGG